MKDAFLWRYSMVLNSVLWNIYFMVVLKRQKKHSFQTSLAWKHDIFLRFKTGVFLPLRNACYMVVMKRKRKPLFVTPVEYAIYTIWLLWNSNLLSVFRHYSPEYRILKSYSIFVIIFLIFDFYDFIDFFPSQQFCSVLNKWP